MNASLDKEYIKQLVLKELDKALMYTKKEHWQVVYWCLYDAERILTRLV